jgi:ribA/ribD-fused uncharacterized protein
MDSFRSSTDFAMISTMRGRDGKYKQATLTATEGALTKDLPEISETPLNVPALIRKIEAGWRPKFVFFWGHQAYPGEKAGKHTLSQWWEASFEIGGVRYPTAEHYMMAEKARLFDAELVPEIAGAPSPAAAKALGRRVKNFDQTVWDVHRFDIVVRASIAKFGQNPDLHAYLMTSGDKVLVEASPVDPVWGVSLAEGDARLERPQEWRGLNLLGFALMKARAVLRMEAAGT